MTRRTAGWLVVSLSIILAFGLVLSGRAGEWVSGIVWPEPKVVAPGENNAPPADALVLFDGKDMSAWDKAERWTVKEGVVTSGGHDIKTKQAFGSCQLHVEWASPEKVSGDGQGRGNSGVYLMSTYEIQILDSYNNPTYFDGQCAALYKQHPPLVNVCRKPGQWQSYDIVFEAPQFDAAGKVKKPGYVTVLQNGVLVQNHAEILGASAWDRAPKYQAHPEKLPLELQFHGNPVRFRNIWIREL
jgi:hypothetical protein